MERLEGNLSLRERRLARVEKALREADARLKTEQSKFAGQRELLEKGLSQRLRERERQLEESNRSLQEHQQRLGAQLAREREALARMERLARERDQAAAELERARQELDEQQRREREMAARLAELERRRSQWGTVEGPEPDIPATEPITGAAPPASTAATSLAGLLSRAGPLLRGWSSLRPAQRTALAAGAIALPLMCLLVGATVFLRYPREYLVAGWVIGQRADDAQALAAIPMAGFPGVQAQVQEGAALRISATAGDPARGIALVQSAADRISAEYSTPATQPAGFVARQTRRAQLREQLGQLPAAQAGGTRPAGTQPSEQQDAVADRSAPGLDPAELIKELETTLGRRRELSARLADITKRLAIPPPDAVSISPDQLKSAWAGDQRLQADSEVLAGREAELAEALRQITDTARPKLDDLPRKAADAGRALKEEPVSTPQDPAVAEPLRQLQSVLGEWSKAAGELAAAWQEQRALLDRGGTDADPAARQAALENASKKFLDGSGEALTRLNQALDAVAQGDGEPAMRLVQRTRLARQLQPAVDARDALAAAVARGVAAENLDLAGLLGRVSGLRAQVVGRRDRMEASLRATALAEARAAHDRDAAGLRQERERVLATTAALDQALIDHAAKAFGMLREVSAGQAGLLRNLNAERRRGQLLSELHELEKADAREAAAAPPPLILRRVPAIAVDVTPVSARLGGAVLGGAAPLLLAALIAAGVCLARYVRSPSETLEDYARSLRESSLPHPRAQSEKQAGTGSPA